MISAACLIIRNEWVLHMDNEKAFKNLINADVVRLISHEVKKVFTRFSTEEFESIISDLFLLELKDRVLLVTKALKENLPSNYKEAIRVIKEVINNDKLSGFQLWPFSEYVSQFGLNHFEESMDLLYDLTQKFTAEFAIRAFIIQDHQKVISYLSSLVNDQNVHIRRWVSEGTRPLLPWGKKIHFLVDHPELAIGLLEKLKYDEEIYVRKSVANHLNDISKNHPELVIELLSQWLKLCPVEHLPKLEWIKKQALRTLIKKGNKKALQLMGVSGEGKIQINYFRLDKKKYKLNEKLQFYFEIESQSQVMQNIVIDYGIDFVKANGKLGRKIFKLKNVRLEAGASMKLTKIHSLKSITTMRFYSGKHQLTLQVNGLGLKTLEFFFEV